MRELIVTDKYNIVAIANAIREKIKSSDGMTIEEMAELICGIKVGGADIEIASAKTIDYTKAVVVDLPEIIYEKLEE